jgi:hypothetical protein
MESEDKRNNPEPLFTAWSDRMERYIRRAIIAVFIVLILSQFALQFPVVRYWLTTTDESEGIPFPVIAP